MKVVYDFQENVLFCGYHDFSTASGFGYLHIKARHQADLQYYASMGGRTWEDLLWHVIAWATYSPDSALANATTDKVCATYTLKLYDRYGRYVRSKRFKMISSYRLPDKVITVMPNDTACTWANVGGGSGSVPVSLGSPESLGAPQGG